MPTDTEIWERACERVGLWKRGEVDRQCRSPLRTKTGGCPTCDVAIIVQRGDGWHDYPPVPAPAIDDSDAAMKMIAWALKHQLTVCIGPRWVILHNDRGSNVGEGDNFDNDSSRTTPLALANAVLAVPQETQP